MGRKYRTASNLRSNLYVLGIAESGGGKDHARKVDQGTASSRPGSPIISAASRSPRAPG